MMPVYLELFHGRRDPKQVLDDWGESGPVFGPYDYVQTTYATELKLGENHVLNVYADLIYYNRKFYGDWSVFGAEIFRRSKDLQARHQPFEEGEARLGCRATLSPERAAKWRRS